MFTLPQLALGFVIALVLIVAEYFLTVKMRSPLWGGILPLAVLLLTVCAFTVWELPLDMQTIMPFGILQRPPGLDGAAPKRPARPRQAPLTQSPRQYDRTRRPAAPHRAAGRRVFAFFVNGWRGIWRRQGAFRGAVRPPSAADLRRGR